MTARPGPDGWPNLLDELDLPRVPQQARSRAKREAILAVAACHFAEHGYDATTTRDIAEAAGLSIGTVYSYFRDKNQILLALMAGAVDAIRVAGAALQEWGDDPRQTLRQVLARAMPYDARQYGLQRAWATLQRRGAGAGFGERIHALFYQDLLAAVRRAAAAGRTWPDLDIEATCWAILHLLDHAWHTQLDPTTLSEEEFVRQRNALADLVYRALFRGA